MEHEARERVQVSRDITRAGSILAAFHPRSKLSLRVEEVNVIASNESLRHVHDGRLQRYFAVVVSSLFRDITGELSDFNLWNEKFMRYSQ